MSDINWESRISKLEGFTKNTKLIFARHGVKKIISEMRELWEEVKQARAQGDAEPVEFDYDHPQYCEIIERISEATHRLMVAAGFDAEVELDKDEAIEALIYKNIDLVAQEIEAHPPAAKVPEWIACSERLPTKDDGDFDRMVFAVIAGTQEVVIQSIDHTNRNPRYYSHWMPTGLRKPEPPQPQEVT